jgi:hypothetical protein
LDEQEEQMAKVDKVPKGSNKVFARGGRTPMFGKGDRTKSASPAAAQRLVRVRAVRELSHEEDQASSASEAAEI